MSAKFLIILPTFCPTLPVNLRLNDVETHSILSQMLCGGRIGMKNPISQYNTERKHLLCNKTSSMWHIFLIKTLIFRTLTESDSVSTQSGLMLGHFIPQDNSLSCIEYCCYERRTKMFIFSRTISARWHLNIHV